jgi:hypothetical protein
MNKFLAASMAFFLAAIPFPAPAASAQPLDGFAQTLPQPPSDAAALARLFDGNASAGAVSAQSLPSGRGLTAKDLRKSMLQNLDFIQSAFSAQYGPGQWKETHEGWDLDREIESAKRKVLSTPDMTIDQYHELLRVFFGSMHDFHVSVQFNATASSSLPFTVVGSNGRYFIEYIDRGKLSAGSFPFHVGDELLSFGGRKTADVVADLVKREGGNTAQTETALAALFLTSRRAASFGDVESGPISVTVKPQGSLKPLTRQLIWDYAPEQINPPLTRNLLSLKALADGAGASFPFPTDMLSPVAEEIGAPEAGDPFGVGERDGFLPSLGKKTWESAKDDLFSARVYRLADGRSIGYVRIPTYDVDDADASVKEFAGLVKRFEKSADALVIDQTNNPGGSVFYMYALASMLTDRPLTTPRHHVAITQEDVASAVEFLKLEPLVKDDATAQKAMGAAQDGYPVTYEFFRRMVEYSRFIVSQWNQGKTLTDPTFLDGVDDINPSPAAQFTKPIVLLINELDFSGGDFFPATLQDNKRATLFGTRTAGAGGFVADVKFPNNVGVSQFTMTGSIAIRADHQPIENLGVTADVQYAPTAADLQSGFKDYAKAVDATLAQILGPAPAK